MRSRRRNALPPASDVPPPLAAEGVALSPFQQETLFAARAWWFEGYRALDYLAESSRRAVLFERLARVLDDFRADPSTQTVRPVLLLARQLTANRALNRTLYSDPFAQTLQALLYGTGPLFDRLHVFLQTAHVGPQTASHLLFAAFPDRYPLVSQQTRSVIAPTPAQRVQGRTLAAATYGGSGDGGKSDINEASAKPLPGAWVDARTLLADFALYEAVRDLVQADTFDTVHSILRHSREMPHLPQNGTADAPKSRRKKSPLPAGVVREPAQNHYAVQANAPASAEGERDGEAATENDLLVAIEREIAGAGFTFAPLVVRRYYVSLKAKPFVILSGLSGTGKTRLTSLLARALCGPTASERDQYLLIPVRPDWTSSDALLGYHNLLTDRYVSTPFLSVLQKAALPENRDRAFFVCLDEMNLARVEHYFSDILSAMETLDGRIPLHESQSALLPPNVFLTGSVNMDEATYPFSRKVLDRANTIEFSSVSFAPVPPPPPAGDAPALPFPMRQKLFLSRRVLSVRAARERMNAWDTTLAGRVVQTLTDLNTLLTPRQMHFGYRVRDEVLRYVAASFDTDGSGLFAPDDAERNETLALDTQIVQKVLPHIVGTHETLRSLLADVQEWAAAQGFEETARKLSVMQTRGEETGVVSFYEP